MKGTEMANETTLYHYTQQQHLLSIMNDDLLRVEGHNIEQLIRQIHVGNLSADKVRHPSGLDIKTLWKGMKQQYKLVGRYVWLTEEEDARCITAQRHFEKVRLVFNASDINAKRWTDVMTKKMFASTKAKKLVRYLNETAKKSGDDITKWWVVEKDISFSKHCIGVGFSDVDFAEKLAA
jgi:hypothetical protein